MADKHYKIYTVCPIVRREQLALHEMIQVAGEYRAVPFTKEILWVRESESKVLLTHKGHLVDERMHTNDYYGFATSPEAVDAVSLAKRLGIDSQSTLAVEVHTRVVDKPLLEDATPSGREWNKSDTRRRQYLSVPQNDWFVRWHDTDPDERKYLGDVEVVPWTQVWSSAIDGLVTKPDRTLAFQNQWRAEAGLPALTADD